MNAARHGRRAAAGFATSTPPAAPPLLRGGEVAMRETMPEDGEVDAAASYRDPRAVPLRDAAKLLDLDYSMLCDDVDRHELMAEYVKSGRYRIVGYETPRRLSDKPALVEVRFVKAAFQAVRWDEVFDPVHDRLLARLRVVGQPSRRMLAIPARVAEYREMQRLMALPPAIDWTGRAIRVGRYGFVDCKAIRAEDLSMEKPEPKVETAPQRTGPHAESGVPLRTRAADCKA